MRSPLPADAVTAESRSGPHRQSWEQTAPLWATRSGFLHGALIAALCVSLVCSPVPRAAPAPPEGSASQQTAAATRDVFGVRELYPTAPGGREWYLPATAQVPDAEWKPDSSSDRLTATDEPGVFQSANIRCGAGRAILTSACGSVAGGDQLSQPPPLSRAPAQGAVAATRKRIRALSRERSK